MDNTYIVKYKTWLRLEKGLSPNTIEAYLDDLNKLFQFVEMEGLSILQIRYADLQQLIAQLYDRGISPRSLARIISGIKSFYRFLLLEDFVQTDPTELLESPKTGLKLPEVLSVEEVNRILNAIDLSLPAGQRNRAMLEVLYSCGLRVSELINLKYPDIYFDEEFIRVEGKGKKQRLVPISQTAIHEIRNYLFSRRQITARKGFEDILFLNQRGAGLSRVMVFYVIKEHARFAGIT
jgi:integrase/recombinase XerD